MQIPKELSLTELPIQELRTLVDYDRGNGVNNRIEGNEFTQELDPKRRNYGS